MRIFNSPSSLKLLVGVSLLLLLCFLGYWNFQNYDRLKVELHKDLTDQMSLATSDYKDSIVQIIFEKIDLDSIEVNGNFDIFNSDAASSEFQLSVSYSDDPESKFNKSNNKSSGVELGMSRERTLFDLNNDTITHTIEGGAVHVDSTITVLIDQDRDRKVIVWSSDITSTKDLKFDFDTVTGIDLNDYHSRDSSWIELQSELYLEDSLLAPRLEKMKGLFPGQHPNLYNRIDTLFAERLNKQNIDLKYKIVMLDRKEDAPLPEMAIPLEYGDLFGTGRAYAIFENYNNYILSKMTSSILMSLLLFSVLAFAFYSILNSWLSQMRLSKVKSEFISNMTHELKTPISTVGVAIEALENFGGMDDAKKRREYLDISKHELNRLTILVDKVLKMSTLENGADEMVKTKVDVKSLTEDMLGSMKLHFEKNHVVLDYKVEGEDFLIYGDKVHLTNVLYNLIDNAIKYSGDNPVIKVDLSSHTNQLDFSITDNGPGIPKEYQPKVFDRFFRVPSDDKHNVKGHGLGLHYVKTVVSNHQGSVRLKSEKGKGTTFIITIPKKNG